MKYYGNVGNISNTYLSQKESKAIEKSFRELFRVVRDVPQCQVLGSHCEIMWFSIYMNQFSVFWTIEKCLLPFECTPYY